MHKSRKKSLLSTEQALEQLLTSNKEFYFECKMIQPIVHRYSQFFRWTNKDIVNSRADKDYQAVQL